MDSGKRADIDQTDYLPGLVMVTKLTAFFERKQATIVNFANHHRQCCASHCSARLSVCSNEGWSVCDNDSKSAIGLRGFVGALKNGQETTIAKRHRFARFHRH